MVCCERSREQFREYKRKEQEKKRLVASGKRSLARSGNTKIKVVRSELNWVQSQSRALERDTTKYVNWQKGLNSIAVQVFQHFKDYHLRELYSKNAINSVISVVRNAKNASDLIEIRERLVQLEKEERALTLKISHEFGDFLARVREGYARYLKDMHPLQKYLDKYELSKLEEPTGLLEKLTQAKAYADSRASFMAEQLPLALKVVEDKMENLLTTQVERQMTALEARELKATLSIAFTNGINELTERHIQVLNNQTLVGCGQKLKPAFDLYTEVLAYKPPCANLENLNKVDSEYYSGCVLLRPTLQSAEGFMENFALSQMRMTVVLGRFQSPENIREKLEHLSDRIEKGFPLEKLVQLHDEVIQEWESNTQEET